MEPDRWQRVKAILEAALDREERERQAFLSRECGDDDTLRREVESLLDSSDEAEEFLEETQRRGVHSVLDRSAADLEGTHLGPYRILQAIGHGGMGTVYLAVRDDEQYKKRVSVKVAQAGALSDDTLRRLRQERQILATLEHDSIAKLLDGGTTPDGRPYFVMEYVEGLSIDRYCDTHQLSIDERLALFRKVCAAVQHAHRNLVVHRDLKPSNILVTVQGVPKLLDFGIAKLLNPELGPETLQPTRAGLGAMTLEYASPEQVRNGPITTSADVYSLGVLLYELLTGLLPYKSRSRSFVDIARAICEVEPIKASSAVDRSPEAEALARARSSTPRSLERRLRGDLDAILLKALRKEPQRRYVSVEQLSEDLRRHRERLPVDARGDAFSYRSGKFLRRHSLGVSFAAILLLLMVALTIQSFRVTREVERAKQESYLAQQISDFILGLFELSEPSEAQGNFVTAKEILDRGAERISAELVDRPETQARMMETIGTVYRSLGLYEEAGDMLERALQIRQGLTRIDELELAENLANLGRLYFEEGRHGESERSYREALELTRNRLGDDHPDVAKLLNGMAGVLWRQGRFRESQRLCERAIAIIEASSKPDTFELARYIDNLAISLDAQGRYQEAEPLFHRALRMREESLGANHPEVATSMSNLGEFYEHQGRYGEAEHWARRALEIRERILGPRHQDVATSLNTLATIHLRRGRYEKAERAERRALEIYEESVDAEHSRIAESLENLASLHLQLGRLEEAEQEQTRALETLESLFGPEHPEVARAAAGLGLIKMSQGHPAEARDLLERALFRQEKLLDEHHPDLARTLHNLATLEAGEHRLDEAGRYLERALAGRQTTLGPRHPDTLATLNNLGLLQYQNGDATSAEATLRQALEARGETLGVDHPDYGESLHNLGILLARENRPREAVPLLRQALTVRQQALGPDHPATLQTKSRLAALTDRAVALVRRR